jgi:hypothetical protein
MSNNKQQTAVEWLIEQLRNNENIRWRGTNIIELGKQAKAMHKEQIKNAFTNGFISSRGSNRIADETFYNETYGDESNP